jgi:hypothetical protein
LSGVATIPANKLAVDISVESLLGGAPGNDKTVVLSLRPSRLYNINSPSKASLSIT